MTTVNLLSILRRWFIKYPKIITKRKQAKKRKVTWLGMISAGKTSLIERITKNTFEGKQFHTMGIRIDELKTKKTHFIFWEIGGAESFIRTLWDIYTRDSDGIVFVIDSTAPNLFPVLKDLIENHIIKFPHIKSVPVLLLANKQDLSDAMTVPDLVERLELHELLDDRPWAIFGTSAVTAENLSQALRWLQVTIPASTELKHAILSNSNVNDKTLFQYLSRFNLCSKSINQSNDERDREFIMEQALDLLDSVILDHFIYPRSFLYLNKVLHNEISKNIQRMLKQRLERIHPSFSFRQLDSDVLSFSSLTQRNQNVDEIFENVLLTLSSLKEDWTLREMTLTTLLEDQSITEMMMRCLVHLRPLLTLLRDLHVGTHEISLKELEFMVMMTVFSRLMNQHVRDLNKMQDLVTTHWNYFLDSVEQKIFESYNKQLLISLLETNLPENWVLDCTTWSRQWLIYHDINSTRPGPPFYLKILLEDPKEPRVQAVLACPECEHLLPTTFIPCIILSSEKKIRFIDNHSSPISDRYLLTFGKVILLVMYADLITSRNHGEKGNIPHESPQNSQLIDENIKTQFHEKFGLTCSHYQWM